MVITSSITSFYKFIFDKIEYLKMLKFTTFISLYREIKVNLRNF